MNFGMIMYNQNMLKMQIFVIWIPELYCSCKKDDIYKGVVEDVETRFDTSNFEIDRMLPKRKNNCTNER